MKSIKIIKPDDWHVHFRDHDFLKEVVPETTRHFSRAIVMPNLSPPILNGEDAKKYKVRIQKSIPKNVNFLPLMTIYLTEKTNKEEIKLSYEQGLVFAAKLYPAGATTNSESGVNNVRSIMPVLEIMSEIGMPLLIHGEVTDKEIDIFDREKVFIDTILDFICKELPDLKITLEHITTRDATLFVKNSNKNIVASITPHHLAMNRNAMLVGGIKPHYYCLPILKRENHRLSLVEAATSQNTKFFPGTDSAPHLKKDKESSCGCAGVFNATYCMSVLAQLFEQENSLDRLENFVSINGARHYGLELNKERLTLEKSEVSISFKKSLQFQDNQIDIFKPDFPVYWKVSS